MLSPCQALWSLSKNSGRTAPLSSFYTQGNWGTERSKFQQTRTHSLAGGLHAWPLCWTTVLSHLWKNRDQCKKRDKGYRGVSWREPTTCEVKEKVYSAVICQMLIVDDHCAKVCEYKRVMMLTPTCEEEWGCLQQLLVMVYYILYIPSTEYFTCRISFNLHRNGDWRVRYNYPNFTNEEMMEGKI